MARRISRHPIPYYPSRQTPLLRFGRRDHFTIDDATQGVQIYGGTGSGKSSGSGKALAHAYLRAGFGGIVCCSKVEEADVWRGLAKETGREHHLFFIDINTALRFNFMDYARATIGADGFERNMVTILQDIATMSDPQAGAGGGDNEFFRTQAIQMLLAAFVPVREFEGTIRFRDINRFIASSPRSAAELQSEPWQRQSYFNKVFLNLAEAARAGSQSAQQVCADYGDYWFDEMTSLGDRTRSSVIATVSNTLKPFLTGIFEQLFCTRTDIIPEHTREGAIIVLDLPIRKYGKQAAMAQQMFKLFWQYAMENTAPPGSENDLRPAFCFCDEAQFLMNPYDAEHLAVARSAKACSVYITQDVKSYYANVKGTGAQAEHLADSLLGKFQTRIFHANTDLVTNEQAAEHCGKTTQYQESRTQGGSISAGGTGNLTDATAYTGGQAGQGVTFGTTISTFHDYVFPPSYFAHELRTGGRKDGYKVDAILIRNGKNYRATGKHYLKATFSQR